MAKNGIPAQVEAADKMAREYMGSLEGESPESNDATDSKNTEEEETEDETSGDEAEEDESEEEDDSDSSEEDAQPEDGSEEETWEQRYKSLKGMFDAEVPRLNEELKELKSGIFEKLSDIADKKTSADSVDTETKDEMPEEIKEFVEEYGEEYIKKLNKYLEYQFGQQVDSKLQPVNEKVEEVEDATVRAAQKQFSDYLDGRVEGDWQSLMQGEDENFINFLQSPDPSGLYTNGELMRLYNDNWDADRLALLLNTYLGANTDKVDADKPTVEEVAKDKKKAASVAPKRKKASTAPDASSKRIWTQADIKQFERDDRQKKFSEEESAELWNDLKLALSENRIRD